MKLIINKADLTSSITDKYVKVSPYIDNNEQFYSLTLELRFTCNNEKGYLSLDIGKEKENDINSFTNKIYDNSLNGDLETYDTKEFYDLTLYDNVILKTGNIKDNKLYVLLTSTNEECLIEYEDEISIQN